MTTDLVTQCLQRDFVDPIGAHDPLPNLLHVGYSEAARLLGPEPSAGPLAQLIDWARSLAPDAIDLIHIRDWHDPNDPAQREHLQRFGAHCLQGSSGARLILGMDERAMAAANERIVDSLTLNDLEGTNLARQLGRIRHAHGDEPLRVGVVGVWTEAKVSFLLYDLKTRFGIDELATCSALTASASRAQHFNALAQLEKILGVRCFDSPLSSPTGCVPAQIWPFLIVRVARARSGRCRRCSATGREPAALFPWCGAPSKMSSARSTRPHATNA